MRSSGAWIRTTTASFKDSRPYQLDDAGICESLSKCEYANIESGIWESNPSVRFGRPVPLPLGQSRARAVDGARTRTQGIKSPLLCHSSYDGQSGCGRN